MLQDSRRSVDSLRAVCNDEKLVNSYQLRLERADFLKLRRQEIVRNLNKFLADKEYDFIEVMGAYGDAEVVENLVHAVGFSAVQESLNLVRESLHLCACHGEPMKYKSICMIDGNPTGERDLLGLNDAPYDSGE